MEENKVLSEMILSESTVTATVHAPIEKIDIADRLLNLPDREYQRCAPPDHKAAEIAEKQHCHMVSLSDVLTSNGWTTAQVIWDLRVRALDDNTCEYINSVTSHPTSEFLAFSEQNGVSFEDVAAARQAASGDHNRRETPLFAASIERKALAAR